MARGCERLATQGLVCTHRAQLRLRIVNGHTPLNIHTQQWDGSGPEGASCLLYGILPVDLLGRADQGHNCGTFSARETTGGWTSGLEGTQPCVKINHTHGERRERRLCARAAWTERARRQARGATYGRYE
jgi:hypothetical protein